MARTFRHFIVEPLADGVWAAIHAIDPPASAAWGISNAGIVDLGDRTLLFDTMMATAAADELREAAKVLTGRPPDVVVYSHAHNDHTWGGSRFPEALLVSSARTRAVMLSEGPVEVDSFRGVVADRLAFWAAATEDVDPLVRRDAPYFRPYWDGIAATLPALELRYPDVGFEGRLDVHGRDRDVQLVALETAHAPGDTFLVVPDARVAFCGDLLFVGCHPYLGDGDVAGLRDGLALLEASGADRFVPGHGPIGHSAALRALAGYIDDVERAAALGAETVTVPDAYREWLLARFYPANLEFLKAGGRRAEGTG